MRMLNIKRLYHFAIIPVFFVFCLHLGAVPLYVAPNGSSSTHPYDTWEKASTNIQWAVGAAVNGDTVWISNGTYYLTNYITVSSNITISGIDTGDKPVVDGNNACRGFYFTSAATGTLANLFITRGYASSGGGLYMAAPGTVRDCIFSNNTAYGVSSWNGGGGAYFENTGSNLIQSCTFVDNKSALNGGGVKLRSYTTTVAGCTFRANIAATGGGGLYLEDTYNKNILITNCDFICNVATNNGGGGGYFISGTGLVAHCTFASNVSLLSGAGGMYMSGGWLCNNSFFSNNIATNSGGGMSIRYGAIVKNCVIGRNDSLNQSEANVGGGGIGMSDNGTLVQNCIIEENRAGFYGGGVYVSGGILRNCLIRNNVAYGNSDGRGGAMRVYAQSADISSCAIVSNCARIYGGGIYNDSGATYTARVDNCIIYFNQSSDTSSNIYDSSSYSTYSNCCLAARPTTAVNCITNQNPQFVNWTNGNYRLNDNSPCINAGLNQSWMEGAVDLDGRSRTDRFSRRVDMGAYEHIYAGTIYTVH